MEHFKIIFIYLQKFYVFHVFFFIKVNIDKKLFKSLHCLTFEKKDNKGEERKYKF